MRVLLVTMYFPPAGGGGVARPLKLATHLPELGIETHVLAPDDPKWLYRDDALDVPPRAHVHRVRYVGPRGRLPAEELHGLSGAERALRQAALFSRRLLVPDEFVSWGLTAIPAARRIVREEGIDVLVTTSPPASLNLIGAAVRQATGVPWVADLRDSVAANPDRRVERLAVRVKERGQALVARLVARQADAVVAVSDAIADEMRDLAAERPILAAVPPDGVAAELVRRADAGIVVPPDDVGALGQAIAGLRARWKAGALDGGGGLTAELREHLSRRTRSR